MLTSAGIGTFIAAAGLLGVGAALNYPELVQLGAVGVGASAFSAGLAWRRPKLDVRVRLLEDRVVDGEAPRLLVTVANRGRWRCFVTRLRLQVGEVAVRIELGSVRPRADADFAPPMPIFRRGVYLLEKGTLGYRDPFDFARANHRVDVSAMLYVHPRTEVVAPMAPGGPQDLEGRPLVRSAAGGDAFYSLREYLPGDDWRRIHWPTTARQAILMVRHTILAEETTHVVVLDTERTAYADDAHFEHAVGIAASLCQAALRAGHALSLLAGAQSLVQATVEQSADHETHGTVLDLLAGVQWASGGIDEPTVRAVPAGSSLMAITGRPRSAFTGWLSDVSRHVAASHLVQVLGPAQQPVPAPAGVSALTVDSLVDFCAAWQQRRRP